MSPLCNFGPEQVTSVSWKDTVRPRSDFDTRRAPSPRNLQAKVRRCKIFSFDAHECSAITRFQGDLLAVGTRSGFVQIWNAVTRQRVRTLAGHTQRVGNLAWNGELLTTGSRDRRILHRDSRTGAQSIATLTAHRQEICGLKWDVPNNKLASGGNDNRLLVWDYINANPIHTFAEHTAAVKAIAWNPHQRGILASGGGTADKTIKIWDINVGQQKVTRDTGSQVCNLAWSQNENELLSTHGYSQNHIAVWEPDTMDGIVTLTGHCSRVLYLAKHPDGEIIATGAGDETVMFWFVPPSASLPRLAGRPSFAGNLALLPRCRRPDSRLRRVFFL
ncbi:MAG: WD40-repeat-containing domain protein [Olpidium bornovanus]|uniref:WD40-repeat-containing domain protein n=1 Tax=Olpidium bornovanus TaxID=278681 RepID=A0A8H7ZTV9_9FUNG|nr:MAG: WD40-repeat-containing domain protein [Olpidium bornovanus]